MVLYNEMSSPLSRCFLLTLKFGILVNTVLHLVTQNNTTNLQSLLHNRKLKLHKVGLIMAMIITALDRHVSHFPR